MLFIDNVVVTLKFLHAYTTKQQTPDLRIISACNVRYKKTNDQTNMDGMIIAAELC